MHATFFKFFFPEIGGVVVAPPVLAPPSEGARRKLKRRRATIRAHAKVLEAVPGSGLAEELEIARRNLLEAEALGNLFEAQDQLLINMYRKVYLQAMLRRDDEAILWIA